MIRDNNTLRRRGGTQSGNRGFGKVRGNAGNNQFSRDRRGLSCHRSPVFIAARRWGDTASNVVSGRDTTSTRSAAVTSDQAESEVGLRSLAASAAVSKVSKRLEHASECLAASSLDTCGMPHAHTA